MCLNLLELKEPTESPVRERALLRPRLMGRPPPRARQVLLRLTPRLKGNLAIVADAEDLAVLQVGRLPRLLALPLLHPLRPPMLPKPPPLLVNQRNADGKDVSASLDPKQMLLPQSHQPLVHLHLLPLQKLRKEEIITEDLIVVVGEALDVRRPKSPTQLSHK